MWETAQNIRMFLAPCVTVVGCTEFIKETRSTRDNFARQENIKRKRKSKLKMSSGDFLEILPNDDLASVLEDLLVILPKHCVQKVLDGQVTTQNRV